ncbi:hypothetical protein SAMN05216226_10653 [Halovenus aranensis]|uniref:Uncharacterized protein n=2 Tax=Halovenus aranensis TaxID=890420 RepID=A0A1G8V871_9EURY|nr:hypothetical protein SAMN05216226_10653 [Halovenus aranensis]
MRKMSGRGSNGGSETQSYRGEISDTLESITLHEELDFDLNITEAQYKSNHDIQGELQLDLVPTKEALRNRQSKPTNIFSELGKLAGKGLPFQGYPGTRVHVGISERSEEDQNDASMNPAEDGLPANDTLSFDCDWEARELKDALAEDEGKRLQRAYDIEGYPSEQLPLIVRAKLYRDAVELFRKQQGGGPDPRQTREREQRDRQRKNERAKYEGLAALSIALEHRENVGGSDQKLRLDRFRVDMSRTFPDIEFVPEQGSTYNPEQKRVEWNSRISSPGDVTRYVIIGPIGQLLDLNHISAEVTGQIVGSSLSGKVISGAFDESGKSIWRSVNASHEVDVDCSIEIDPDALSGEVQKKTEATFNVVGLPENIYSELENICRREGIHVRDQRAPAEAEPAADREGVWEVKGKEDRGELDIKREFGNRGVVYASILVTGEYTPSSKEQHVSASEDSSDKLVRADEGALDRRGRTQVEINARSASSDLNTELINTFEEAFPGGEAK